MAHSDTHANPLVRVFRDQYQNLFRLLGVVAFVAAWWLLSLRFPPSLLPGPALVFGETYDVFVNQRFFFHFQHTIVRVLASFVIAMVGATALGAGVDVMVRDGDEDGGGPDEDGDTR